MCAPWNPRFDTATKRGWSIPFVIVIFRFIFCGFLSAVKTRRFGQKRDVRLAIVFALMKAAFRSKKSWLQYVPESE
jgi:hypothetical protein